MSKKSKILRPALNSLTKATGVYENTGLGPPTSIKLVQVLYHPVLSMSYVIKCMSHVCDVYDSFVYVLLYLYV